MKKVFSHGTLEDSAVRWSAKNLTPITRSSPLRLNCPKKSKQSSDKLHRASGGERISGRLQKVDHSRVCAANETLNFYCLQQFPLFIMATVLQIVLASVLLVVVSVFVTISCVWSPRHRNRRKRRWVRVLPPLQESGEAVPRLNPEGAHQPPPLPVGEGRREAVPRLNPEEAHQPPPVPVGKRWVRVLPARQESGEAVPRLNPERAHQPPPLPVGEGRREAVPKLKREDSYQAPVDSVPAGPVPVRQGRREAVPKLKRQGTYISPADFVPPGSAPVAVREGRREAVPKLKRQGTYLKPADFVPPGRAPVPISERRGEAVPRLKREGIYLPPVDLLPTGSPPLLGWRQTKRDRVYQQPFQPPLPPKRMVRKATSTPLRFPSFDQLDRVPTPQRHNELEVILGRPFHSAQNISRTSDGDSADVEVADINAEDRGGAQGGCPLETPGVVVKRRSRRMRPNSI